MPRSRRFAHLPGEYGRPALQHASRVPVMGDPPNSDARQTSLPTCSLQGTPTCAKYLAAEAFPIPSNKTQTNGPMRGHRAVLITASVRHRTGPPVPRQADFLFFLSSSTSVNSASTTSSLAWLLAPSPPAPAPSPPPPPCAWAYIASPSFIEACASALVFWRMASASSPFTASRRSAIAFSIALRSLSPTLEPC